MMSKIILTALCLFLPPASAWADGPEVAAPHAVHFHSVNLRNRLRWTRGRGPLSHNTTYTVEYAIYGDAVEAENVKHVTWYAVKQCTDITQLECDLTEQTRDLEEEYYARVRVSGPDGSSDWTETLGRFRPMSDTTLGPPQMEVTLRENNMQISLKGPFRWRSDRTKGRQSLWLVFPHMTYNVSMYSNRSKHTYFFLLTNGSLVLGPLDYDSEHCVMAAAHSLSLPLESQTTPMTCVRTPRDPFTTHMLVIMLGGLVPTAVCLFVLAVAGGLTYHYIHGPPKKPPQSTDMVHIDEKWQTFQPEKPLIISLNLVTTSLGPDGPRLGYQPRHGTAETERLLPVKAHPLPAIALPSGASEKERSAESSYAAQNTPQTTGPETALDSASETASNTASGPWCESGFPDDYGMVFHMPLQQDDLQDDGQDDGQDDRQDEGGPTEPATLGAWVEQPSACEVNLYRVQSRESDAREERNKEMEEEDEVVGEVEEAGLRLDWNPQTGVLKIPLLCPFGLEDHDRSTVEPGVEERAEASVDTERTQPRPVLTSVVVRQCSDESREEDVFTTMEKVWELQIQSSLE